MIWLIGWEGEVPSYRICFMNEIPRNGRLFRCCQRSILIQSAPSAEWAVEAAKQQFAALEGIRDWKIHAARIEIEPVDLDPETENPAAFGAAGCHARKTLPWRRA
jgi:hypothetical protein